MRDRKSTQNFVNDQKYKIMNAGNLESQSLSVISKTRVNFYYGYTPIGVNINQETTCGYKKISTYEDIYWNYPQKGKISVVNRFFNNDYRYTETYPLIEWSITDETDTVIGYSCTKAIASDRVEYHG